MLATWILEIDTVCGDDRATYIVTEFPTKIGRGDDCGVRLDYLFISRDHARIERTDTGFTLVDENSRFGIRVGGQLVSGSIVLEDGTEFAIERLVARVRIIELTRPLDNDTSPLEKAETSLYASADIVPSAIAATGEALSVLREARIAAFGAVARAIATIGTRERHALARELLTQYPELSEDLAFRRALASAGVAVPPPPGDVALHELEKLAKSYAAHAAPLTEVRDVVRIANDLDQMLDVCLTAKSRLEQCFHRSTGAVDVQDASDRNVRAVADGKRPPPSGVDVIIGLQRDFFRLEIQVNTLIAELNATRSFVTTELAPANIARGNQKWWYGPFSGHRLWKEFVRRWSRFTVSRQRAHPLLPEQNSASPAPDEGHRLLASTLHPRDTRPIVPTSPVPPARIAHVRSAVLT
ncbi:MAG TPA: FHA domain-containing protein [Polyangiaceae bacterium]|nr:FHA domain-containing protein [Polyangiaceae bacterium]